MITECPMTEDCPGFERDRRVCLVRPADCGFAPDPEALLVTEEPDGRAAPDDAESRRGPGPGASRALRQGIDIYRTLWIAVPTLAR
jgi:hypothetical protein